MQIEKKILNKINKIVKNKKVGLHEPHFDNHDFREVLKCLKSSYVSTVGSYVERFERKIAKYTKSKYVLLTNSGTSALYIALKTIGVDEKSNVLVPSLSFVATANAIKYNNAKPIFIDSSLDNFGMCPTSLENFLKEKTFLRKNKRVFKKNNLKISAIIVGHLFGACSEMSKLIKISKKFKIPLVEDSAEALGCFYKKKHLGSIGEIGILSFNGNKIITSGAGGAFMTDNYNIFKKAEHLSQNAKKTHKWKYEYDDLGYNIKMPNLNAALGFAQIKRLGKYILYKKRLFTIYAKIFSNNKAIEFVYPDPKLSWNFWLVTILLKSNSIKIRDKIIYQLNKHKIGARPIWQLNHKIKIFKNCPKMDIIC